MASTIQLKTGTSGAPSNLTNGEVAINVNDGLFYYGSGSGNVTQQLESFTHITASGNISASGIITAEGLLISDDATITDNLTIGDDLFFTGHSITVGGGGMLISSGSTAVMLFHNSTSPKVTMGGTLVVDSHITASGNISASGNIDSSKYAVDGHIALDTNGSVQGRVFSGTGITNIQIGRNGSTNRNIELLGPVTASGAISASGNIKAAAFFGDITGDLTGEADTVATIAGLAPNTATTQATQAAITTAANLTTVGALNVGSITSGFTSIDVGSGAITTTGTVSAEHVLSSDDIVALGEISASGTVTAAGIRLPGQGIISFDNSLDGTDQFIKGADHNLIIDGDDEIRFRADDVFQFQDGNAVAQVSIDPNAGHITASGNISSSGTITADDGSGNSFTVRPNLFYFATNDGVTDQTQHGSGATDNQGSLPATNTTTIALSEEQNSHSTIFSLSSNRVTIARAGLYKITYNACIQNKQGSNRSEGFTGIVQETSGGDVSLIDGSEGRGYHRFVHSTPPSAQTYAASCIVDVAANSIYDLRFGMVKQALANQRLRTIPTGTSFMIEAIT